MRPQRADTLNHPSEKTFKASAEFPRLRNQPLSVVAGTDFAADMSDVDPVGTVESLTGLSAGDRDMILRGNAARPLTLAPGGSSPGAPTEGDRRGTKGGCCAPSRRRDALDATY